MDKLGQRAGPEFMTLSEHSAHVALLFNENNRALTALLVSKLGSMADAQEVAQEAYMRVLTLENPALVQSLRAYLFRIAFNLAVDRVRMRGIRTSTPIDDVPEETFASNHTPDRHVMAHEQWRRVREALRELPAKTSRAFVMHMVEGRELSTVAQAMKLSERMVRYHVTHALAHCRARIDHLEMP